MEDGLAAALRRGERRALDRAVERYTAYLSAVVRRTLGAAGTAQDVEELVSDVFLTLWRRREGLEDRRVRDAAPYGVGTGSAILMMLFPRPPAYRKV